MFWGQPGVSGCSCQPGASVLGSGQEVRGLELEWRQGPGLEEGGGTLLPQLPQLELRTVCTYPSSHPFPDSQLEPAIVLPGLGEL